MARARTKTKRQRAEKNEDLHGLRQTRESREALTAELDVVIEAGESLCQSERRFCTLAESMQHFVWEAGPDGTPLYANQCFLEYTGMSMQQVQAGGWLSVQHPDDAPHVAAAWRHAVEHATEYDLQSRFREAASGAYRWFRIQGSAVRDGSGQIVRWVGTCTDMHDTKRAEEMLAKVASFPLLNPNPIVEADLEGNVLFVNPAARKTFPDIEKRGPSHPFLAHWRELAAVCHDESSELPAREVSVGDRWYHQTLFYSRDTNGIRIYGLDITERERTEQALRRAKEEWERTFDTVPDLIAILDCEQRIVRANRAMTQRLGMRLEECRDQLCYCCLHGTERAPGCCPHVLTLADGQEHTAEVHEPRLGGDFLVTTTPLRDAQGRQVGSVHVARDITERKLAEDRGRLLSEVTSQLLASDQPQPVVESLCRKVTEHLGCHVFFNYLVDEASGRLHLNAHAGIPEDTARQIEWLDCGAAVCGCVARDGRPIVVEQIQTSADPRTELVRSFGLQAYACHPLLNQGRVIGTLSFGSRTKSAFGQDELGVMKTVADQVAIAMQRLRLLEASQQHAQAAEAANAAKDQFLANVSHELRTPMAAILGMTELALRTDLSPTVRDYLKTAKESADGLMQLLNELLDFSRIEAGGFQLEAVPFRLRAALDQTLRTLGVRASEKGLELVCNLAEDLPEWLVGDPLRLRQILMNLVGNAIKFTARGRVSVGVATLPLPEAERCAKETGEVLLQFDVTDTGVGISPGDQQRIFAPFTQADASTTRQYGGTGLGLSIASSLVRLMGGRIWVESKLGRGSTFHFTARFQADTGTREIAAAEDPLAAGAERRAASRCAVRRLRVLLAEDTIPNQKLIVATLSERGHAVEIAPNGREALELFQQQDFDVVLMDVQMPIVDGFQTTAAIRALTDPVKARVPIVAMTAHAMAGDRQRCLAAGMDGYLTKPISSQELIETVECLTNGAEPPQATPPRAASGPPNGLAASADSEDADPRPAAGGHSPPGGRAESFHCEAALASLGGRINLLQDMAAFFLDDAPRRLAEIQAGLQDQTPSAIARAAHRLKGTLVYLGAEPALQAAQRVEQIGHRGDLTDAAATIQVLTREIAQLGAALRSWRERLPAEPTRR